MKIINKGAKYTIYLEKCDGTERVCKVGVGTPDRYSEYFPERDIAPLAGTMSEKDLWSLISDIVPEIDRSSSKISPQHIFIKNDGHFTLSPYSESDDERFRAPEGYDPIWALGATIFFMVLEVPVFNGYGGRFQKFDTPIPFVRRNMKELSEVVAKCLKYTPLERPSKEDILSIANLNLERLAKSLSKRNIKKNSTSSISHIDVNIDKIWPEKMI